MRKRVSAMTSALILIGALICMLPPMPDFILYNEGASTPNGAYLRSERGPLASAFVTVRAVDVAPEYARVRMFTDAGDRFIKRVAAVEGEFVCASADGVQVGAFTFPRARHDSAGLTLPRWEGCRDLAPREFFLMGDTDDSFDSRYFGPVAERHLEGVWRKL